MHEIKFRAWVKEVRENGELQYGGHMVDTIHSLNFTKITNLMTGVTPIGISCFVPGLFYGRVESLKHEEVELMQYTGLKDKNGVEIYEGDIFRTSTGVVAIVEWEKEGRFLGFTVGGERKIVYINRQPAVEVIGNIYEHRHLLEGDGRD